MKGLFVSVSTSTVNHLTCTYSRTWVVMISTLVLSLCVLPEIEYRYIIDSN